jgi:hypothetical protein
MCGTSIVVAFAFDTFKGHFDAASRYGLDGYGRAHAKAPVDAVSDICNGGAMQKDAVKAKITRIEIRWGGTGNSSFDLNGKTVVATISPHQPGESGDNAATYRDNVVAGLKQQL